MTIRQRRILMQAQQIEQFPDSPYYLIGAQVNDDLQHSFYIEDIECVNNEYHCLMTRLDQSESLWVTLAIIQHYL